MPVVVGCTSKKSVSQCVKELPLSGVDNAASPWLADTAERDYFTPERLITMQKQLEGTQKYINEQWQSCPYRWATHAIIVSNTHALPAEHKCLAIKPSKAFTNVCWVLFNNIFCRHKFWLHRQFSSPNSRNEEMMGDGFPLVLLAVAGLFWTVNVCWAHPVQDYAEGSIFSWCYSRCFLKFVNRM